MANGLEEMLAASLLGGMPDDSDPAEQGRAVQRPVMNKPGVPVSANQTMPRPGLMTPVGPATSSINTLRGNVPGMVAFYSPEQQADIGRRGITLGGMNNGAFEWNQGNMDSFGQQMQQRALMALEAQKYGGQLALAKADEAKSRAWLEQQRAEMLPGMRNSRTGIDILHADPSQINNPHVRSLLGFPITPADEVRSKLGEGYTPEQAIKSDIPLEKLKQVPSLKDAAGEAILNEPLGLPVTAGPIGRAMKRVGVSIDRPGDVFAGGKTLEDAAIGKAKSLVKAGVRSPIRKGYTVSGEPLH